MYLYAFKESHGDLAMHSPINFNSNSLLRQLAMLHLLLLSVLLANPKLQMVSPSKVLRRRESLVALSQRRVCRLDLLECQF